MLGEKPISKKPRWKGLLRSGTNARREDSKNQFYPVLIDEANKRIVRAGATLPYGQAPDLDAKIDGYKVAWPIRSDLSEGNWGVSNQTLNSLISKGYVALGRYDANRKTWGISYLSKKPQQQIESGELKIIGFDEQRKVVDVEYSSSQEKQIKTVWHRNWHDAGAYGSDLVSNIVDQSRAFSFPKSLYAERDCIAAIVRKNPNALIVDFFAGSGTTLHAVNLINAEDNGNRRCILVTNNETSEAETKELLASGYQPGEPEWEARGICRSVTWPRTVNSILGKRGDGSFLSGEYLTGQTQFKEVNRSFYQLNFIENPSTLSYTSKKQIVALIGKNTLPQSLVKDDSHFIVSEKHTASVLFEPESAENWLTALEDQEHITEFYIVSKENKTFNEIKSKVIELLGTLSLSEPAKRPMSEGFHANAEYFKLGFLDKNSVSLGQQFNNILPLLWMKAGAVGKRPEINTDDIPSILTFPNNKFSVLNDERDYVEFERELEKNPEIQTVFVVTDSESAYREIISGLNVKHTYQLYRDYLDNFSINIGR